MPLIYAFAAREDGTILAEYSALHGNFREVATECLPHLRPDAGRLTITCDAHTFNYARKDSFIFLVVADEVFGRVVPFAFLARLSDDFINRFGSKARTAPPLSLNRAAAPLIKQHMVGCCESAAGRASHEIRSVGSADHCMFGRHLTPPILYFACRSTAATIQMRYHALQACSARWTRSRESWWRTLKRRGHNSTLCSSTACFCTQYHPPGPATQVLERGERIQVLVDKTDELRAHAARFQKQGRALRSNMWWANVRMKVIVVAVVLLLAVVIFLLACFAGGKNCIKRNQA
jgi:hypothetical protein